MHIFCYDDFIHNYYWPFYFIDKYRSTQPCKLSASWHECCHCCDAGGREREPSVFAQLLEEKRRKEKIATLHFTSLYFHQQSFISDSSKYAEKDKVLLENQNQRENNHSFSDKIYTVYSACNTGLQSYSKCSQFRLFFCFANAEIW